MSNMNETVRQQLSLSQAWTREADRPSAFGSLFSIQSLKQAALRIADIRHGKNLQTRDLVGLLISHAARNKRLAQPRTMMRMTLPVNLDRVAVRLTIEN
ncbi:hypothetical protein KUG47_14035 [Falsochrobactrum sp. TDYN1]|uniref:Uncharacterized protein n=1 Tax=Falsochrobactrum tianjinense TaxID=2706015 RepID=A0A949UU80_9HYPH|nr:hypothetical protein [Falsochrobactrum sp. TDYN1]MBV2144615.1 hypothetical protein [Falsochrobactrum sp. TDYN1]